jgi:hypothetical protein
MDQAVRVGDGIEAKQRLAQLYCPRQSPREKRLVDRLIGIGRQDAQGNARVAVVEAAANPLAVAIKNVHHRAAGQLLRGPFHHLLKNPGMGRLAGNLEADLRKRHQGVDREGIMVR